MHESKWLENIKPGDAVVVWTYGMYSRSYVKSFVEKITPKGYIKVSGCLYLKDGNVRGSGSTMLLNPEDQDVKRRLEDYEKERLIMRVMGMVQRGISYEEAKKIMEILKERGESDET